MKILFDFFGDKIVIGNVCAIGQPYIAHYGTTHVVIPIVYPGIIIGHKFTLIKGDEHDFELNQFKVENTKWIKLANGELVSPSVDNNFRMFLEETAAYARFKPVIDELEAAIKQC